MKKHIISLLLALVMVFSLFPVTAEANELDNAFQYETYDGEVWITKYIGNAEEVVIPAEIEGLPVTVIYHNAFSNCYNVTKISIPNTVYIIGVWAFSYCTNLTSIAIPNSVTSIGHSAFYGCSSLTDITIPGSVTSIELNTFYGCSSLTSIAIPNSVSSIEHDAFHGCSSLTSISIPESVTFIDYQTFSGCTSLANVSLPESLTCISTSLFAGCSSLTDITIPDNITSIGEQAFHSCTSLTSIAIPDGVTSIGARTFSCCSSLTNITIPDSITSIGEQAFFDCTSLTSISIPDGVTSIGEWAFYNCSSLTNFSIPNSVTSISDTSFAFCSSLTNISIPGNITSIECYAFSGAGLSTIHFEGDAPQIATNAFSNVIANAYYPADNATWTADVMQNYGGTITWIPDGPAAPANPFTDVPAGSFYEDPVLWAVARGITNGLTASTFGPDATCNRAQVVTFLWRAAGCPEPTSSVNPFVDVEVGSFYEKPVLWAVEKGITNGSDATHFNPNGVCNRAQVVTFLYRAFESPAVQNTANPFTDVPAGDWYTAPVLWAVENGITNGLSATEFGPNTSCNRAQVVTFLYRAYTD